MTKYKISHERELCIGCCACEAIDPEHWKMNGDCKVDLVGAKKKEGADVFELEVEENKEVKESAESCPVECIKVEEI